MNARSSLLLNRPLIDDLDETHFGSDHRRCSCECPAKSKRCNYDRKTPDKCACLYTLQIGCFVNDQMQEVRGEPTTAVN